MELGPEKKNHNKWRRGEKFLRSLELSPLAGSQGGPGAGWSGCGLRTFCSPVRASPQQTGLSRLRGGCPWMRGSGTQEWTQAGAGKSGLEGVGYPAAGEGKGLELRPRWSWNAAKCVTRSRSACLVGIKIPWIIDKKPNSADLYNNSKPYCSK